ncbi:hypothetical protein CRE_21253 [Caenorhabditis remanei]|uniref:Uncharacterized protein n=1 Tax=Caenorhabditis remanei TaxID=31234 RepID=E3MF45_CAERE|nr:hypothetical protein CRE_21253 [Caenorhabditis remanei]
MTVSTIPSSSSNPPSYSFYTTKKTCNICGDRAQNARYGEMACSGCNVFFRRTILEKKKYVCWRGKNCAISYAHRCVCRYCRFQKCVQVGLRAEAIQQRDSLGPRILKIKSRTPEIIIIDETPECLLEKFVKLQWRQTSEHHQYFIDHKVDVPFHRDASHKINYRRRAQPDDINVMLQLSLRQATQWGNNLRPFECLPAKIKRDVLAEYFIAFMLLDQGAKTSREASGSTWLIQNGSFMHPDYCKGLSHASTTNTDQLKSHYNFVSELIQSISEPLKTLEIRDTELAALKILLLLRPSCSSRNIYSGQEGAVTGLYTQLMEELMEHSIVKFPDQGALRFGKIVLLLNSIRCGIKAVYNYMRGSDLFNVASFDEKVRNILLS